MFLYRLLQEGARPGPRLLSIVVLDIRGTRPQTSTINTCSMRTPSPTFSSCFGGTGRLIRYREAAPRIGESFSCFLIKKLQKSGFSGLLILIQTSGQIIRFISGRQM